MSLSLVTERMSRDRSAEGPNRRLMGNRSKSDDRAQPRKACQHWSKELAAIIDFGADGFVFRGTQRTAFTMLASSSFRLSSGRASNLPVAKPNSQSVL